MGKQVRGLDFAYLNNFNKQIRLGSRNLLLMYFVYHVFSIIATMENNSLCSHLLASGGALALSSATINKRAASFQSCLLPNVYS